MYEALQYVLGCKNSAKVEYLEKGSKDVGKSFSLSVNFIIIVVLLDIEPRTVACGPVGPHVTQDLDNAISFVVFFYHGTTF